MRKVRINDKRNGDFTIEVPDGAKITFGYFNPSAAGDNRYNQNNVAKQTALRIYEGSTDKSCQIACFVGVDGFYDEALKLKKTQAAVEIEEITKAFSGVARG